MNQDVLYDVWWKHHEEGDQGMENDHIPHWKRVLSFIPEEDLSQCSVLDFGCNQGGFLRLLYEQRPFKEGIGTDLARRSVEVANSRKGDLPIQYVATAEPEQFEGRFDLAFSLAVLYLIPDLGEHARKMKKALKPGGVYYATFADYSENPSLPYIQERINSNASIPMQEHTLDHIAEMFFQEGFRVGIRRMIPTWYLDLSPGKRWYQRVADHLQYAYEQAYVLRFEAPGGPTST
ncbi:class I SAM-dependent methyltransferase [Paenibacillus chitinolyticus]|uniref:class I SAM-dependent methyltransferase n=1 Tax=Paenibacillus chitinolyticus TaxID=79263 RepID=UPI0036712A1B